MLNRRGERRDIFSCLNTYDVFFVLLEEERHRKGDGGQLILILLPVKRSSKDGLIPKRRTVDEQKPPVGSERCVVGPNKTPDPATPIACERRASSHAGSASVCRYCVYATNWYPVECTATRTGSQFFAHFGLTKCVKHHTARCPFLDPAGSDGQAGPLSHLYPLVSSPPLHNFRDGIRIHRGHQRGLTRR